MLNRSASLAMSTSILKALPGKLDIKRHSPSILYIQDGLNSRCGNEFNPSKCQLVPMAGLRTKALLNSAHVLEDLCQYKYLRVDKILQAVYLGILTLTDRVVGNNK